MYAGWRMFEDQELSREPTTEESSVVQMESAREVKRSLVLYNLDAILAVGYRVRSPRGVQFLRWATTVLTEYLTKGFVLDDDRLKNPDGRPDYFDEMLARIRDIRASEKRFDQKVRDLFSLSSDYDKTDQTTQTFFATVQNMLLYAVTQKTAAELITARTNPSDPHFAPAALEGGAGAQAGHPGRQELSDRGRNRHPESAPAQAFARLGAAAYGIPTFSFERSERTHFAPRPFPVDSIKPSVFIARSTSRTMSRLTPGQASSNSEMENGSVRLSTSARTRSPLAPRPCSIRPTRSSNSLYARSSAPQK